MNPKILFVDDTEFLLELFQRRLARAGFDVSTASNGEAAMDRLREQTFDAIICDINMPNGMDGFEVYAYVRKFLELDTPFIFLTGHSQDTPEMKKALDLGADEVYTKPIESAFLIKRLTELIGKEMV